MSENRKQTSSVVDTVIAVTIGMSDGLIIPMAVTAGLFAAGTPAAIIVRTGLILVAAGTLIMTIGGYLAARAGFPGKHVSRDNSSHDPVASEEWSTRQFLARLDLDRDIQDKAAEDWKKEKAEWETLMTDEMSRIQQGEQPPHPLRYGFQIGVSYLLGGFIPVLPYVWLVEKTAFVWSLSMTLLLALGLGWLKARITDQIGWQEVGRVFWLTLLATAGTTALGYLLFA